MQKRLQTTDLTPSTGGGVGNVQDGWVVGGASSRSMKKMMLVLLFALPAVAADMPVWMAGSWRADNIEEHWTTADGGLMLGMSKTAGKKVQFEFLRIVSDGGKPAYLAMPQAHPATTFAFKSESANRIVFENLKHDFPQRIIYWKDGEKLCARIEGKGGDGEQWCYSRMR
jgi:hypothetical protein